jgi:hypothetical protein
VRLIRKLRLWLLVFFREDLCWKHRCAKTPRANNNWDCEFCLGEKAEGRQRVHHQLRTLREQERPDANR